jgi:hypothetical protein
MAVLNGPGLFTIDGTEIERLVASYDREGWQIFRLPGSLASKDEFFEGIRQSLPLDPPLQSNRSWDALSDSLWSGLDNLKERKIVIVWPDASRMKALAPEAFSIATSILMDLISTLADEKTTLGNTKDLRVLQVV